MAIEGRLLKLLLWGLDTFGVNALFRLLNRDKAIILWYHGICDDGFTLLRGYDERHIPWSLFRQHLEFLTRKGYSFTTMSELVEQLNHKKSTRKLVVLTFDDGFRNVVEKAYPLMKEFKARGCFYLASGLAGTSELLWTDCVETAVRNSGGRFKFVFQGKEIYYELRTKQSYQRAMKDIKSKLRAVSDRERREHLDQFKSSRIVSVPGEFRLADWEQITSLDKSILEVGSHTRTHPNCANLTSPEEFKDEIGNSRTELERMVGYQVAHFCYPAGSYNDRVIEEVKKYGYVSAVTTRSGFNDRSTDRYQLRRIGTNENFRLFKAATSGSLLAIGTVCRWLRGRRLTG